MPKEVCSPITSRARESGLPLSPGARSSARSMPGARDSVPGQPAHGGGSGRGAHAEEISTARIHGPQEE
jgi:hypothetical protein